MQHFPVHRNNFTFLLGEISDIGGVIRGVGRKGNLCYLSLPFALLAEA